LSDKFHMELPRGLHSTSPRAFRESASPTSPNPRTPSRHSPPLPPGRSPKSPTARPLPVPPHRNQEQDPCPPSPSAELPTHPPLSHSRAGGAALRASRPPSPLQQGRPTRPPSPPRTAPLSRTLHKDAEPKLEGGRILLSLFYFSFVSVPPEATFGHVMPLWTNGKTQTVDECA